MVALYDQVTSRLRQLVAEAYVAHRDDADPVRPLVGAFVHGAADDPRVARVAFIEAAGISANVEEHRRRTRNDFVDGLQAIGADLPRRHQPSSRRGWRSAPGRAPGATPSPSWAPSSR